MLEVWGSVVEDEWGLVDPASYVFPYLFCLPVLHWPARCVPGVLLAGPMLVSYICPSAAHSVWLGHTVPLGWCIGTLFVLVGVLPRVFFLSCHSYGAVGSCYWLFVLHGWIHNELSGFN